MEAPQPLSVISGSLVGHFARRVQIASIAIPGETAPSYVAIGADVISQCLAINVVVFRADEAENEEAKRSVVEIREVIELVRGGRRRRRRRLRMRLRF